MFTLKIETDNASFGDGDLTQEVARLLGFVSEKVEARGLSSEDEESGPIFDSNGNRVGEWNYTP